MRVFAFDIFESIADAREGNHADTYHGDDSIPALLENAASCALHDAAFRAGYRDGNGTDAATVPTAREVADNYTPPAMRGNRVTITGPHGKAIVQRRSI